MKGFREDKQWSDRFIPEMRLILGTHLIGEPPEVEDQKRNTDLIILAMDPIRVACRVRRPYVLDNPRWSREFTIRACRPNGMKTELEKVLEGWGTHILYGISDRHELFLARWFIGDLDVFRSWYLAESESSPNAGGTRMSNHDGSSHFLAFNVDLMPREFFIAGSKRNGFDHCMDLFSVNDQGRSAHVGD